MRRAPTDAVPAEVLRDMGAGAPLGLVRVLETADLDDTAWAAYLFRPLS